MCLSCCRVSACSTSVTSSSARWSTHTLHDHFVVNTLSVVDTSVSSARHHTSCKVDTFVHLGGDALAGSCEARADKRFYAALAFRFALVFYPPLASDLGDLKEKKNFLALSVTIDYWRPPSRLGEHVEVRDTDVGLEAMHRLRRPLACTS
jgi:hypothetical protein